MYVLFFAVDGHGGSPRRIQLKSIPLWGMPWIHFWMLYPGINQRGYDRLPFTFLVLFHCHLIAEFLFFSFASIFFQITEFT